jgi:hypothetical protein
MKCSQKITRKEDVLNLASDKIRPNVSAFRSLHWGTVALAIVSRPHDPSCGFVPMIAAALAIQP